MRRTFLSILGVALLGVPAAAEPVTRPRTCELTITRAPDAVRAAIEAWVKAEPQCSTSLELRVVPTDGGFYLIARDGNGRLRERVVPDAQSAGVLVASWMADDVPAAGVPVGPAPVAEPAPVEAAPLPPAPPGFAPPAQPVDGIAAPIRPPGEAAPLGVVKGPQEDGLARRWTRGPRAFSVGALFGRKGGGVRGELDLRVRGPWTLGLAFSLSEKQMEEAFADLEATDARAVAMVSRSKTRGRWTFRLHGGVGATRTSVEDGNFSGSGVFATAEASATVARDLRRGWSAVGGPLVTWYLQDVVSEGGAMEVRRNSEVLMFVGVRHRR